MLLLVFEVLYRLVWIVLTPLVLVYLWRRGVRDARYTAHVRERFASYAALPQNAVWIHAVSLGEVRSAVPLARDLLAAGEDIVFTHFTPAGRAEAARVFASEIAQGRVASVWVPLDMFWTYGRFFRACRPKIGLSMEIEIWPAMILAARRAGVPLYLCNAQYPNKSIARDSRGLRIRQRIMTRVAGAFVKSDLQAARFASIGVPNIHVTGELRFDHPVPPTLLAAAGTFAPQIAGRRVITIASAVEGEDATYIDALQTFMAGPDAPLAIYVPRAPERFERVAGLLRDAGLSVVKRSDVFPDGLSGPANWPPDTQILLGDSMGEMYFYIALASRVVVGGGFIPNGAHNIIEPLALEKPVMTGPYTHTIEYPFAEAQTAGVAICVADSAQLAKALCGADWTTPDAIAHFVTAHSGASARTCRAIMAELAARE